MKVGVILPTLAARDAAEGTVPAEEEKTITYACVRGDDRMILTTEQPHPLII